MRSRRWLSENATRATRRARSLDLAAAMVDNVAMRNGTRYDALRMLAVPPWDRVGAQLSRYLSPGVDAELQAGAIGVSDLQDNPRRRRHRRPLHWHPPGQSSSCSDTLLRTEERRATLRDALARAIIREEWLTADQRERR